MRLPLGVRHAAPLLLVCAAFAQDVTVYRPTSPDPREFPIVAWGGSPSEPELLRGMKEAGITVSGFCKPEDLDKVHAAGLHCYVMDKRISLSRDDWEKLPPEDQIRKNVASLVRQVGNHPAALGYYLVDEPNYSMMANLGKVSAILHELAPDKLPYVNLFNTYCSRRRFAPVGYEPYVRSLVDVIHQPFLSYDMYALVNGELMDRFYHNLEIIRRLGLEMKVPFWNIVLANAHFSFMEPTDATVHLQAYATMAYGGRGLQWFTYMGYPGMRLSALDPFGHQTPTWGMLQRINFELHTLAPTLLKLHSTGVYHYPDPPEQGKYMADSKLVKSVEMTQDFHRPGTAGRYLIGEFEDGQGRAYVMIVNKDLKNAFRYRIEWKKPDRKVFEISSWSGQEGPFTQDMNWLAPGAGTLLRVE
jgi:hypothetical protein